MTSNITNKRTVDRGDGWVIEEHINQAYFGRYTKYFYKNKRAPRILIKSKVAQQLAGYSLIEKDLRNILIWLAEIDVLFPDDERYEKSSISPDRKRFDLVKGLFVSSLVFYAKCFTRCEGRRIKLESKSIDDEYQELHDSVMSLRNNFAAHSGADKFEEVKVALVLPPKKRDKIYPVLYKELLQADMMLTKEDEADFKNLVLHVQAMVRKKMGDLETKIMNEEILPKGMNYWYKRAKRQSSI